MRARGVHLTSYNDYNFKWFFQTTTMVDRNKKIMSTIIDNRTNHYYGNSSWRDYSPTKPLAAPNIMQEHSHVTPRHNAYIATSEHIKNQYWKHVRSHRKNIHTLMFTYSIVTWNITLASSEKKENHVCDNTIQLHSFKYNNHVVSHHSFPTTTRHTYVVLPIT